MKKLIPALLTILLFSCSSEKEKQVENDTISKVVDSLFVEKDSVSYKIIEEEVSICECEDASYDKSQRTDITFANGEDLKAFLKKWSHDSVTLKVKSITFSRIDTIPKEFSVFKKIEKVRLVGNHTYKTKAIFNGLEMFPKLKHLVLSNKAIRFKEGEKWQRNIEIFQAQKSYIYGVKSLNSFPSLKIIVCSFSNFSEIVLIVFECSKPKVFRETKFYIGL